MLPSKFNEKNKKEKQELISNTAKVTNGLIENYIKESNMVAIKTIFYIANQSILSNGKNGNLHLFKLNKEIMAKYCGISGKTIERNIKAMQKSTITVYRPEVKAIDYVQLIPKSSFYDGKQSFEIYVFDEIYKMMKEIQGQFFEVDLKRLMKFRSVHTLRFLPILEKLEQYSNGYKKTVTYTLEEWNGIFETDYKRLGQFEANILKKVQKELDNNSTLTFIYEKSYTKIDKNSRGRSKATGITINLVELNNYQSTAPTSTSNSSEPKEISTPTQTKIKLLEKRFEELANNITLLNYLDLPVEYEINEDDVELTKEFEKYIAKQLFVFFQYCRDNDKNYKNLATSFKRHIRGAYKNNLDFFSSELFLQKEYRLKSINEMKQNKQIEEFLMKHNNTNFEMILNDEKEQIFVINNKLFVSFEGNLLAINDKKNMLKVVEHLKSI